MGEGMYLEEMGRIGENYEGHMEERKCIEDWRCMKKGKCMEERCNGEKRCMRARKCIGKGGIWERWGVLCKSSV